MGQPGAAYTGDPKYRMSLSNPLLLEEVLVRHPKLRLYVMHAGWPMGDAMIGLLYAHPQIGLLFSFFAGVFIDGKRRKASRPASASLPGESIKPHG